MSSAGLNTLFQPTAEGSPWDEVRRIYRRACLLRARGHGDEADAIEGTELDHAIAHARELAEPINEDKLLAEEADRVAQACLIADLVAPLLADRLRAELALAPAIVPASAPAATTSLIPARPTPPNRPPVSGPPLIADLIEGMLAQERPRTAGAHP